MSGALPKTVAERIASRLRSRGFDSCTLGDVLAVWALQDIGNPALESAILQEFDEYGLYP